MGLRDRLKRLEELQRRMPSEPPGPSLSPEEFLEQVYFFCPRARPDYERNQDPER